ncbi:MAG: hypothetical protein KIIPBIDF_01251 [Candidatus Methanoperedenaceae archaeon GB50]|nr:MAG: hypothetical protein KIIPBIDF_01251 [Candidatus Methanoperedenaceae archaeon GB50]
MLKNPKAYGFEIKPKDPWDCDKVHTYGLTDLTLLSKETMIPLKKLKRLNPALRRPLYPTLSLFFYTYPKRKKEIVLASLGAQAETTQVF